MAAFFALIAGFVIGVIAGVAICTYYFITFPPYRKYMNELVYTLDD